MIAQIGLSLLLGGIVFYAWTQSPRAPVIGFIALLTASAGFYFVWFPSQATYLAEQVGIGRGADMVLYVWVVISLLVMLNLHLKLRAQMELLTILTRELAVANARLPTTAR